MIRMAVRLTPASTSNAPATGWFIILWLLGLSICLVRLAFGALRGRQIVQRATAVNAGEGIRSTSELIGPVAWGFGNGLVLLPEDASAWPSERRRAIVLHEAAHLARRDCWSLLIAELACALYWFHPLAWHAAARMRREQEKAADDYVLQNGVDAQEYAEHLVALARSQRSQLLMAGAVTRSDLSARIEAILDSTRRRHMLTRRVVATGIAALLIITVPLTAMQTGRKIYKVSDAGVTRPILLEKEEPKYSEEARDAKIEGSVTLSGVLEADGRLYDVRVEKGLEATLDDNAIAAVQTWRFKPAEKEGKPVAVSVRIEVNFRLI
jgi:TonB family protein